MLYRFFGATGLQVSEVALGCASYWGKKAFSETEAIRLVEAAVDHGVNFFDTGASYSAGNAEPRLGRALAGLKGGKHNLVVATKAGSRITEGKRCADFSPAGVRKTVEESLVRLGLDAIPLLQLHGPEISYLTDELLDTLSRLKSEGKILHLGVNSFDMGVIAHVMTLPQFGAVMIDYNIFRPERAAIIKQLSARRFGILAGMALGGGLYRRRPISGIRDLWYVARAWKNHQAELRRAKGFQFINDEAGVSGGEIALAWVLQNPDVSCAVIGTTRMAHLLDNLRASGRVISADVARKIAAAQLSFQPVLDAKGG
jgi:aryl-alcohol dehydrogenase-like predicted oxidoreductase